MTIRPVSMLCTAALLALPTIALASSDDSAGHGGRSSGGSGKNDVRVGRSTVASFDGTTLVITRADGSTISGAVTRRTEFECQGAGPSASPSPSPSPSGTASRAKHGSDDAAGDDHGSQGGHGADDAPGDDHGSDDAATSPSPSPSASPASSPSPSPSSSPEDSPAAGTTPLATPSARACGASKLVVGASVRKARLRGTTFKSVQLYRR